MSLTYFAISDAQLTAKVLEMGQIALRMSEKILKICMLIVLTAAPGTASYV